MRQQDSLSRIRFAHDRSKLSVFIAKKIKISRARARFGLTSLPFLAFFSDRSTFFFSIAQILTFSPLDLI